MPRRTKEDAEKTRQAILKAAEQNFYEKGVMRTSLQEIARTANVTRGAVYWHFRDKADILKCLADDLFLPHEDLLHRIIGENFDDPLEALCRSSVATLNAMANDPRQRRLMTVLLQRCEYLEEMEALAQRNADCRERVRDRLEQVFVQAAEKDKLAACWTPRTAAYALQALVVGFIRSEMEWKRPSRSRDTDRTETILALFGSFAKA